MLHLSPLHWVRKGFDYWARCENYWHLITVIDHLKVDVKMCLEPPWCILMDLACHSFVHTTFWHHLWSITNQCMMTWNLFVNDIINACFEFKRSIINSCSQVISGGAVASWLLRSTLDRVVQVWALAGVIVLCSKARHFTLTVLLFTQVYKWVSANKLGVTLQWTCIPSRGIK